MFLCQKQIPKFCGEIVCFGKAYALLVNFSAETWWCNTQFLLGGFRELERTWLLSLKQINSSQLQVHEFSRPHKKAEEAQHPRNFNSGVRQGPAARDWMRGDTSYLGRSQSRGKNNSAKTGGELAETDRRLARMCEAPEAPDVGGVSHRSWRPFPHLPPEVAPSWEQGCHTTVGNTTWNLHFNFLDKAKVT